MFSTARYLLYAPYCKLSINVNKQLLRCHVWPPQAPMVVTGPDDPVAVVAALRRNLDALQVCTREARGRTGQGVKDSHCYWVTAVCIPYATHRVPWNPRSSYNPSRPRASTPYAQQQNSTACSGYLGTRCMQVPSIGVLTHRIPYTNNHVKYLFCSWSSGSGLGARRHGGGPQGAQEQRQRAAAPHGYTRQQPRRAVQGGVWARWLKDVLISAWCVVGGPPAANSCVAGS